jgi:lipid-binding SYLF domain-containing protein
VKKFFIALGLFCAMLAVANEERVLEASNALQLLARSYKHDIPRELLTNAQAIAVFPSVTRVGFFIGGLAGDGVMSVKSGSIWQDPLHVSLGGGSLGLQFGVERSDIVLFIMNKEVVDAIMQNKITLGADASVAAGPMGASVTQMTDFKLSRDIYVYASNRGAFAGASIGGSLIGYDDSLTIDPQSFAARSFIATIERLTSR